MNFEDYLQKSKDIADEEKEILDLLSSKGVDTLSKIEIRAVKSSLQTLIENSIGKAKKILKYYNCPIVPSRSKDAVYFLYECGAISDEMYRGLVSAIGFRNCLVHDYMKFDVDIMFKILKEKRYMDIYDFIVGDSKYSKTVVSRIESYSL